MPEWLRHAAASESPLSFETMALRLVIAAAFGLAIAGVYRLSHGRLARDSRTLFGTLVLLTILLAMVTMVIGDSVARAFGLVGALSIVRFRTVVEDTRDTAFVIFAVVVGMAIGTGLVLVAVAGVPIVGLAAIVLSARSGGQRPGAGPAGENGMELTIRVGASQPTAPIDALLGARTRSFRLCGVATARQGVSMDLTYTLVPPDDSAAHAIVAELNAIPGVQGVELRAADEVPRRSRDR